MLLDSLSIPGPLNSFDFGTATSPLATGSTQVTETTAYTASTGYGWLATANQIASLDTGVTTSFGGVDPKISRDLNYTTGTTYQVDAANGLYDVTLVLGDARGTSDTNVITFNNATTPTDTVLSGGAQRRRH